MQRKYIENKRQIIVVSVRSKCPCLCILTWKGWEKCIKKREKTL